MAEFESKHVAAIRLYCVWRIFAGLCVFTTQLGEPYQVNWPRIQTYMDLTFRGPCIVIYSYNKTNSIH